MRLSASLVHGLGWLQEARLDPKAASPAKLASLLIDAASEGHGRMRKLAFGDTAGAPFDPFGVGSGEPGDSGDDDFLSALDGVFSALDNCGVDTDQIMGEIIGGEGDMMGQDGVSADSLAIFAEEGEVECTGKEEIQFFATVDNFISCTGWGDIFSDDEDSLDELGDELDEKCDGVVPESPFDFDPASVDANGMAECLDLVLGDNALGRFMRDLYHHPDKNCACVAAFGDEVPECLIDSLDDDTQVPGSLFKKAACLVGEACAALEGMCLGELQELDQCLPAQGDSSESCDAVGSKCAEEGAVALMLPAKLTVGELPDTCERVFQENRMAKTEVLERFAQFESRCNEGTGALPNEATGALVYEATEYDATEYDSSESASKSIDEFSESKAVNQEQHKKIFVVVGVVLAAGVAAAAFFVAKKGRPTSDARFVQVPDADVPLAPNNPGTVA